MNYLPAMDWSAKWDWENLVLFNSKTAQSPKKQPTDWGIEGEGEIDSCSFNLSGGGSVSDFAQASSARSSTSASTDSSSREVMKMSKIAFEAFHTFPGDYGKKNELTRAELAGTSPPLECSGGSGEQLIGLKLGKRTYFENNCTGGNAKILSFSGIPVSSALSAAKKNKSSCQTPPPCCQVEGCNLDLSSAKEYHRKHRVCASHSKCPKVVVGGLERRFCQQCSRFHSLSEFDEKKRSCRRRLSDHNARRRKPPHDTLQFNSRRLSSPFLDGRQQMSFILNNASLFHTRPPANPMWESACSSKFTVTKAYPLKSETTRGIDWQLQLPHTELAHASSMLGQNSNKPLPHKGTKHEVFDQGLKEAILSSNYDAVPEFHRALSLLSTDSWGSAPANITFDHPIHENLTNSPQPVTMLGVPHSLPFASSPYWQIEHSTETGNVHNLTANDSSHFQEIQLFKAPCESGLFPNLSN